MTTDHLPLVVDEISPDMYGKCPIISSIPGTKYIISVVTYGFLIGGLQFGWGFIYRCTFKLARVSGTYLSLRSKNHGFVLMKLLRKEDLSQDGR